MENVKEETVGPGSGFQVNGRLSCRRGLLLLLPLSTFEVEHCYSTVNLRIREEYFCYHSVIGSILCLVLDMGQVPTSVPNPACLIVSKSIISTIMGDELILEAITAVNSQERMSRTHILITRFRHR